MTTFPENTFAALALKPVTSKGKPAKLDGVPVWSNSNPGAGDLFVDTDGLSGRLTYLDEGSGQIRVDADADLGAGVRTLTALLDFTCLPAEAVVITLEAGEVTPIVP